MSEVGRLADRYLLGRRLGAGSFGEVYEAVDAGRGERVALKLLKRSSPAAIARFKREFRALRDLVHPNLIALHELHAVDPLWFFTMELVDGVDLTRWLRIADGGRATFGTDEVVGDERPASIAPPVVDLVRVASVLGQLADGLDAVHAAGRLHCDLKPNNILVDHQGRLRLCDFGLVADVGERVERGGTAWFMAPEQVAGEPLGPPADWYAVGVMLHEIVSGRLPFSGAAEAVRTRKLAEPAPRVGALAPDAPGALIELIDRLLVRTAGDRAGAADARATARALGDVARETSRGHAASTKESLIGRARELAILGAAWDRVETSTVIVRVLGPSGIGKSALCREFVARLPAPVVVLGGRCYEREQMPFRALDPIIDELCRWLVAVGDEVRAALLPPDAGFLGRLFPVLRSISGAADEQAPGEARRRGFAAARALIARIASHAPLVLWLDDLQWSDPGSGELLAEILRPPGPRLLCLASCRSEDAPASAVLMALAAAGLEVDDLMVPSLAPADGAALARVLGGADADAGAIAAEAEGSPFLVRELALAGARRRRGGVTIDDVVRDRVAELPAQCRALLAVVALAGRPVAEPVATAASSQAEAAVGLVEIAQLRAVGLLRATAASRAGADELDTYHDRVREAVVAGLDLEARIPIHRRLAAALSASGGDLEVIALHHRGAGDRALARQVAVMAAEAASAAGTAERAAALYAFAAGQADDQGDRRSLELARGEQLAIAGQGNTAAAVFAAAAATATGDDGLQLRRRAAELLLRSGHVDDGLASLVAVLREHGLRVPTTPRGALASLIWQRIRLGARGTSFRERTLAELPPRTIERIDALWAAATCLSMSEHLRGADFQARNLRAALDGGEPTRVSRALALEAIYSATAGGRGRARSRVLIARAVALVARTGDPVAQAMTVLAEGICAHQAGEWAVARDQCAAAMAALAAAPGTFYELANARFFWLETLIYLGDVGALAVAVPRFLDDANRRGDAYTLFYLRGGPPSFRWIYADQPGRALAEIQDVAARLPVGFHVQHLLVMLAEAQALLACGDGAAARARIERDWVGLERSQLLRSQNVLIEMTALRGRAALASGDRARAQQCARRIRREGMPWGDALASLIDAALDPDGDAWKVAAEACDACGMRLHAAAARARVGSPAVPAAVVAALAPRGGAGIVSRRR